MRAQVACLVFLLLVGSTVVGCSILGYVGDELCRDFVLMGLSRLEYRGYDSSGFACIDVNTGALSINKAVGKLNNLKYELLNNNANGYSGIGHTRWATHGAATVENAHPHVNCHNDIAVVHNGIIENYAELRRDLKEQGHQFRSDTDSEVLAHLFTYELANNPDYIQALTAVARQLIGTFSCIFCVQEYPDALFTIRKSAPLCVGVTESKKFIASDFLAFAGTTDQVVFFPDESCGVVQKDSLRVYDFDGHGIEVAPETINISAQVYEKLGHDHYMLKEIYEQRGAIYNVVDHYQSLQDAIWKDLSLDTRFMSEVKSIHLIGCGTSWHAARIAQFFFTHICNIPTHVHLASEFRYMPFFVEENALYIAISQSGETADTLEAVRLVNQYKQPIITVSNVSSSTMVRETHGFLPLKAGREISVASTKAFTTQVAVLYWFAHRIAVEKGLIELVDLAQAESDLLHAADVLEQVIEKYKFDIINSHAKRYAQLKRFMFLGRHINFPFAMEAALKLKEISYIFAQGYSAGELKHGSIALIDPEMPVMFFSHNDEVIYKKLLGNVQEVKARNGHLLAVAFEGQDDLINLVDHAFVVPTVAPLLEPIAITGLMQFFVYQIAKELGCDIDQPRNLAKSVTVE